MTVPAGGRARGVAKAETYQRIEPVLNARLALRSELDGRGQGRVAKYAFLRGLDAHSVDLSMLPAELPLPGHPGPRRPRTA